MYYMQMQKMKRKLQRQQENEDNDPDDDDNDEVVRPFVSPSDRARVFFRPLSRFFSSSTRPPPRIASTPLSVCKNEAQD